MKQLSLLPSDAGSPVSFENGRLIGPLGESAPIGLSYGVGVDSTAVLTELFRRNIRPDHIVTALVGRDGFGNEHRRFYEYLNVISDWLVSVDFPPITFVEYRLKRKAKHFHYLSLAGNCIANRTLPSLAFRMNASCSVKYKGAVIDDYYSDFLGNTACYRLIGYDCTETKRAKRFLSVPKTTKKGKMRNGDLFIYPLQLWGLDRDACIDSIKNAGLPSPSKSACIFCPSNHTWEFHEMYIDELWRIIIVEAHAQINLQKIDGLWGHSGPKGRSGRMTDYIVEAGLLPANLVKDVWQKWSAAERPPELRDNPDAVADEVLFKESYKLAAELMFTPDPYVRPSALAEALGGNGIYSPLNTSFGKIVTVESELSR